MRKREFGSPAATRQKNSDRIAQNLLVNQPRRILIIRPSALGDVCRTVPVLVSLRRAFPSATIDWLVQDTFAPAIASHPDLNEALTFPRAQFARLWRRPGQWLNALKWFNGLRERKYDLVIDCQGLSRSGLMAFATRAPQRVGLRSARELAWLAYNVRLPKSDSSGAEPLPVHTVDQMLCLVAGLGIDVVRDMRLYVDEHAAAWWRQRQAELGFIKGRPYAVLAPTSRWLSKRWPLERFSQLIEPLLMRGFEKVVVIGSPNEVEQVQGMFKRFPPGFVARGEQQDKGKGRQGDKERGGKETEKCSASQPDLEPCVIDLVGQTSIAQTMAVIAAAGLVVANDSAPLHMAVGFDRPCLALFGPTDPAAVGPYGREAAVLQGVTLPSDGSINFKDSSLGDSLMRPISTTAVIRKIDEVLASFWQQHSDQRNNIMMAAAAPPTPTSATATTPTPTQVRHSEAQHDLGQRDGESGRIDILPEAAP